VSPSIAAYPEVEAVLQDLMTRVKEVLGEAFFGMYLYGSLATGGFDVSRSDIDFLVVTRGRLSEAALERLEQAHSQLWASESPWAVKLEGKYLPLDQLRRYDPAAPPVPTVNEGRFYLDGEGPDWAIQRHALRQHETVVEGPSLRSHIDPVSANAMRSAVRSLLETWWAPMLTNAERLACPGYTAYAVLSMCRALFQLQFGEVASKEEAANWAWSTLSDDWAPLIVHAKGWREGKPDSPLPETLAFIRSTLERSRQGLGS